MERLYNLRYLRYFVGNLYIFYTWNKNI